MTRRRRPGNPRIAIAYIRVSTEDQNLGPKAQRSAIERWAKREDVEVVEWHEDHGVSGGADLDKRPGLASALVAVRENRAGLLLVAKLDRLARDVVISATVAREVERAGASVASADGAGNGDDDSSKLMRDILSAFAAHERRLIRSRTKAALAEKKRRGERVSRRPPYGYRVGPDGVHLVEDPKEQATVARVLDLRAKGLSLRKVVAALKSQGVVGRTGRPLALTQVARIVRRLAGEPAA